MGNIWTVTAAGGTTGTYVKTSIAIEAYVSYGFTIDDNNAQDGNVWVKIQTSPNASSWTDVDKSTITSSAPSKTPHYYGAAGSCMVSMAANSYIRAVVDTTDGFY